MLKRERRWWLVAANRKRFVLNYYLGNQPLLLFADGTQQTTFAWETTWHNGFFGTSLNKKSLMLPTTKRASGPHCPCVLECLGARSARRIAPAAALADAIIQRFVRIPETRGCSEELKSVGNQWDHHGFVNCPGWLELLMGVRPRVQHVASSVSADNVVLHAVPTQTWII